MIIINTIRFFYRKARKSKDRVLPNFGEERRNFLARTFDLVAGFLYYFYKKEEEHWRVWKFNRLEELKSILIDYEILKNSSKLIIYFLIISCFLFLLDLAFISHGGFFRHNFIADTFDLADFSNIAKLTLEIIVGATGALLGLIFALYAVGFQLSTEKYSDKITEYVNKEKVGNHFMRLLVVTILFSLFSLLFLGITKSLPVISFGISIFLFTMSLCGVIIFKDHYVISLKPLSLFRRMYQEAYQSIRIVNASDNPFVSSFRLYKDKRVKSFRLYSNFFTSWTIVLASQKSISRLLSLGSALFYDLTRNKNYEDASSGPIFFSSVLQKYLRAKRYIDRNRPWAFPQRFEPVSASNRLMYPIKSSYESKNTGPLLTTAPDFNWLEDTACYFFTELQNDTETNSNKEILSGLLSAYEKILCGEYAKNKLGFNEKVEPSAFEHQEYYINDKIWQLFCDLYNLVKSDEKLSAVYMNILFAYGQVVLDGYPVDVIQKTTRLLVKKNKAISMKELSAFDLPVTARDILLDYRERIETEQLVEGKVITPLEWLVDEVIKEYLKKTNPVVEKKIEEILQQSNKMLRADVGSQNWRNVADILKIQYTWLGRLIYLEKWDLADHFIDSINLSLKIILLVPQSLVKEVELREVLEKGLLTALVHRDKKLFRFLIKSYLYTLIVLRDKITDQQEILHLFRLPLIIGAFTWLVSELDNDRFYIKEFLENIDGKFYQEGFMYQALASANKVKSALGFNSTFGLIEDEMQRFNRHYQNITQEISRLPKVWDGNGGGYYTETVEHPSSLVKKIGSDEMFYYDLEFVLDDFVEWLEKREQVAKIIKILKGVNEKRK